MKRLSPYFARAAARLPALLTAAGQIADNILFLAQHDIDTERTQQTMATQAQTDLLNSIQAEENQIIALVTPLIADDATQKARADALQAVIDAGDPALVATLQNLRDNLAPLLTALTPAQPAAPATTVPASPPAVSAS